MGNKKLIGEICYIRMLLILLLVVYHSFCPYVGCLSWPELPGGTPIGYRWVAILSFCFFLPAFVFISGYIVGNKASKQGASSLSFNSMVVKKFQRLMVPSMLLSLIYCAMLQPERIESEHAVMHTLISGGGHFWFLPMLFACFVGVYVLEKLRCSVWLMLTGSLMIYFSQQLLWKFELPALVGNWAMYFVWFCLGRVVGERRWLDRLSADWKLGLTLVVLSLVLTALGQIALEQLFLSHPVINYSIYIAIKLIYCVIGIMGCWMVAKWLMRDGRDLPTRIVDLSGLCFGVYIIQQFIIKGLYYHTDFALLMPAWAVPWVMASITLIASIALARIGLRTRVGRYVYG